MKNSKFVCALAAFFLTLFVAAQEVQTINEPAKKCRSVIGIKGGVNFSNLHSGDAEENKMLTGFLVGGFVRHIITDSFSIQPELYYTVKGAEQKYDNALFSGAAKFKLSYIESPIMFVGNITKNFNLQAGPYVAYLIDAKTTNNSSANIFDFENNLNTDDYNKFEFGLAGGLGFDFDNFGIGARYSHGLTKVGKKTEYNGTSYTFPDAKNSVISIYASFAFN